MQNPGTKRLVIMSIVLLALFVHAEGKQFPIFDGQVYNGHLYPNLDILEWGEPAHLEFQIYQKDKQIDISGHMIEEGNKKIFLFAVDLPFRNERACRRVIAPDNFRKEDPLFFYIDKRDKDMNNILVSNEPLRGYQPYRPADWEECVETGPSDYYVGKVAPKKETKKAPVAVNPPPKKETQVVAQPAPLPPPQKGPAINSEVTGRAPASIGDEPEAPLPERKERKRPTPKDFNWFE